MTTPPTPGYFTRLAVLWLRLIAATFLFYVGVGLTYALMTEFSQGGGKSLASYAVVGAALFALSSPLGKLLAKGLDRDEHNRTI